MKNIRGFFLEIYKAVVNFDSYRSWQNESFSKNLWYLFRLIFLVTFVAILPFFFFLVTQSAKVPEGVTKFKRTVENAFPKELVLTFKNGQLSTNVKEPYYYNLPNDGKTPDKHLVTIATSAQVEDYEEFDTTILVTKNAIVYPKNDSTQKEVMFLKDVKDGKIGYQDYVTVVKKLGPYWRYIYPIYWILTVVLLLIVPFIGAGFNLLWQLLYLVFMAAALNLLAKMFGMAETFKQTYRILMRSSTLPILFFGVLGVFHLIPPIPFAYSLILGIFTLAIFFHIKKDSPVQKHG